MPNLPAADIERLVVSEIAALCRDPAIVDRVITEAGTRHDGIIADITTRLANADKLTATTAGIASKHADEGMSQSMLAQAQAQVAVLNRDLAVTQRADPRTPEACRVLTSFEPAWAELSPTERIMLLRSLVEQIAIDGHAGKLAITFRSSGLAKVAQGGQP